eukprot:6813135-Lingulodinium_polyedra.AAC.1
MARKRLPDAGRGRPQIASLLQHLRQVGAVILQALKVGSPRVAVLRQKGDHDTTGGASGVKRTRRAQRAKRGERIERGEQHRRSGAERSEAR